MNIDRATIIKKSAKWGIVNANTAKPKQANSVRNVKMNTIILIVCNIIPHLMITSCG